jgi:diaminopimelate epimerase
LVEEEMPEIHFTKMHGAGNDYVYICTFDQTLPDDLAELARKVSDRHFGIGGDGMILIHPPESAENDARMQMLNADGSEAQMCGNGIRCVAKYVYDHLLEEKKARLTIETLAGVLTIDIMTDQAGLAVLAKVNMGQPILEPNLIPATFPEAIDQRLVVRGQELSVNCVSMGNPHAVTFVERLSDDWVLKIGPEVEVDPHFPQKVNAEFVEVMASGEVKMRVWERGSGETLACGTGACAVCVAGMLTGRTGNRLLVHLLGGDLFIEWDGVGNPVYMTGPATEVFSGTIEV